MKFVFIRVVLFSCLGLVGCQQAKFGEDVRKYKRGPMTVSDRLIAKPKLAPEVKLRNDLQGLKPESTLDQSLDLKLAQFYERDIPIYKVEPEYKKRKRKVFTLSPEEDAPLQIFLKPAE